jgi:hypothetical protein
MPCVCVCVCTVRMYVSYREREREYIYIYIYTERESERTDIYIRTVLVVPSLTVCLMLFASTVRTGKGKNEIVKESYKLIMT